MANVRTISHLAYKPEGAYKPVTFRTDTSRLMQFGNRMMTHLAYKDALIPFRDAIPEAFRIGSRDIDMSSEGNIELVLKDSQLEQLVKFLDTGTRTRFYTDDFGDPENALHTLAFSYGAKLPVNRALASRIIDIANGHGPRTVFAQWEIADQLFPFRTGYNCPLHVTRLPISGYKVDDIPALARSGLIPGITPRSSANKVAAAIDKTLQDPGTEHTWFFAFNRLHDFDDPLPMARLVLRNSLGNPPFPGMTQMLNLNSLMMLAPEGSMSFYINSKEVIDAYKREAGLDNKGNDSNGKKPSVFLVAQSWHAPRILQLCKATGINVVGGSFVDMFSEDDSQIWVTNPFSWLLKEAGVWTEHPEMFPA